MRIYLAPSAFAPARGGVEELTLKLGLQLQNQGHDVVVLVHRWPAQLPSKDNIEGLPVARIDFSPPGRRLGAMRRFAASMVRTPHEVDAVGARPDVLHVICPSNQLAPLARWAHRAGVPVVITSQGETEMDAQRLYQRSRWIRFVLRREAARAAVLTACSSWTASKAALVAPRFASAEVILNGVDPKDWTSAAVPDEAVVCAWGRHVPQKGLDLLIKAFPLVREQIGDAQLLIGGDGPEHASLTALAGEGVVFLGSLDRAGVNALLSRSRVAVVPSRLEPFGIVAVEALAAGRSLVYSTIGGLAEAASGQGIGVDPNDREALAAAIIVALRTVVDQEGARQRACELSWASLARRYVSVYTMANQKETVL